MHGGLPVQPRAAWLRRVTRPGHCFCSSARLRQSAHALHRERICILLFHALRTGFGGPNFAALGCLEACSHAGCKAASAGVCQPAAPSSRRYLYCFSRPAVFAYANSAAVKPCFSSLRRHWHSFDEAAISSGTRLSVFFEKNGCVFAEFYAPGHVQE